MGAKPLQVRFEKKRRRPDVHPATKMRDDRHLSPFAQDRHQHVAHQTPFDRQSRSRRLRQHHNPEVVSPGHFLTKLLSTQSGHVSLDVDANGAPAVFSWHDQEGGDDFGSAVGANEGWQIGLHLDVTIPNEHVAGAEGTRGVCDTSGGPEDRRFVHHRDVWRDDALEGIGTVVGVEGDGSEPVGA